MDCGPFAALSLSPGSIIVDGKTGNWSFETQDVTSDAVPCGRGVNIIILIRGPKAIADSLADRAHILNQVDTREDTTIRKL